jgi:hypothetical protein
MSLAIHFIASSSRALPRGLRSDDGVETGNAATREMISIVDDAPFDAPPLDARSRLPDTLLDESIVVDRAHPRPVLSTADDDPHSLTVLVEWFQALAGAEWQWT